jgi:tRNA-dihydrouridine synthase
MIARGALWNCSVFQKEPEEVTDVVKKYMKYVCLFENTFFFNKKKHFSASILIITLIILNIQL